MSNREAMLRKYFVPRETRAPKRTVPPIRQCADNSARGLGTSITVTARFDSKWLR